MVQTEMTVFATGSRRQEILQTLRWLLFRQEDEVGFEGYELYQGVDREDKLALVQRWRSREDLERFVRSDRFIRLLEILDLSEAPPELHFDVVSERHGLEFVEALRSERSEDRPR